MSDQEQIVSPLQARLAARKIWFHECHLRKWNLESFRADPDRRKFCLGPDGRLLDGLPDWSCDERLQRDRFKTKFIGDNCDWLGFRHPAKLIEKLQKSFADFMKALDGLEPPPGVEAFPYQPLAWDSSLYHTLSRIELTERKPWLIAELFNFGAAPDAFESIRNFIGDDRNEYAQLYAYGNDAGYWRWRAYNPRTPPVTAGVSFFDSKKWKVRIATASNSPVEISKYPHSRKAVHWATRVESALENGLLLRHESDMGLQHIVRLLYLYGTLPPHIPLDKVTWRKRRFDAAQEKLLVAFKEAEKNRAASAGRPVPPDADGLIETLAGLLRANATNFAACDVRFSIVAEAIVKQALLQLKYWLDEPLKAFGNKCLNDYREANDLENDAEMEYWSENHYIMFASAEYLIGQLWQDDEFLPGRDIIGNAASGKLLGTQRRDRGKARVLKWLNNRLTFGWTEFNSGGYYLFHFYPLANLVDFALDSEVKEKAAMAMDLLLFDMARFTHKGSLGAAGGRVQFKAKRSGWDQDIGDVVEIFFGSRGAFTSSESEKGCYCSTLSYEVPEVLMRIGSDPPAEPWIDRSRVSITFDEAPKYGIGFSKDYRQKESLEQGYGERRDKYFAHVAEVNKQIAAVHFEYGQKEDDTVFWWTLSGFFAKQVVDWTIEMVEKWQLWETLAFKTLPKVLSGDPANSLNNLLFLGLGSGAGYWLGTAAGGAALGAGAFLGVGASVAPAASFGVFSSAEAAAAAAPGAIGGLAGGAFGFLISGPFIPSDAVSIFVEGSIRTRANIYTYRDRDVMLSSLQNFRPGQLNYQSNMNQATLSTEISVFTTSPYAGSDINFLDAAAGGAVLGLPFGMTGPAAILAAVANEAFLKGAGIPFDADHDDGPGWWTGYWSLPMIAQYRNAAILLYDFHWIQRRLARQDSHLWLPQQGLDRLDDKVDANSENFHESKSIFEEVPEFVSDVVAGKHGVWLFGLLIHRQSGGAPEDSEEAYVGVFSDQPWKLIDREDSFYKDVYKSEVTKAGEELNDQLEEAEEKFPETAEIVLRQFPGRCEISSAEIRAAVLDAVSAGASGDRLEKVVKYVETYIAKKQHDRVWGPGLLSDYFAGRDRYSKGKNIWVIQVGSKAEFGSFEQFKERVRKSKIEIDRHELKCAYEVPGKDGPTRLEVRYADGGDFHLWATPYDVDRYPRFENPFVRGSLAEWGQRYYTLEYQGASLSHDIRDYQRPSRMLDRSFREGDLDRMLALAFYIRTQNENMDIFSVARARVAADGADAVSGEVVAVGEVGEHTSHDVEWIYFDSPVALTPDLTIELTHPPVPRTGNDDPHWRMSFQLKALMADSTLVDCDLALDLASNAHITDKMLLADYGSTKIYRNVVQLNFVDENRKSGVIPFAVKTERWRPWRKRAGVKGLNSLTIAERGPGYYDHFWIGAIDDSGTSRMLRMAGSPQDKGDELPMLSVDPNRNLHPKARLTLLEPVPDALLAFASDGRKLYGISKGPQEDIASKQWQPLGLNLNRQKLVRAVLPDACLAVDTASFQDGFVEITAAGSDDELYRTYWDMRSSDIEWDLLERAKGMPRPRYPQFTLVSGVFYYIAGDARVWAGSWLNAPGLFGADAVRIWSWTPLDHGNKFRLVSAPGVAGINVDPLLRKIFVLSDAGEIWCADHFIGSPDGNWERVGAQSDFKADHRLPLRVASSEMQKAHVLAVDVEGRLWLNYWTPQEKWETGHNWSLLSAPGEPSATNDRFWMISRVRHTLEVMTGDAENRLWGRWWS